ncbi:hypothetical protein [Teredinibacter haidensis]|uniref:hypothetical protein n=1 Tax=Teredinibacter haidensis TaxID=2731755 RepID=UPI0009489B7F|nr:hypothetical protein [Teredinibacter haidensis]
MATSNLGKYLQQYSETEVTHLDTFPEKAFEYCIVIPARDESTEWLQRFISAFDQSQHNILLILVINRPETQTDNTSNNELARKARAIFATNHWQKANLYFGSSHNCHLLLVDRFSSQPIPTKQGVGLARKIGCDLACELYRKQRLNSSWIFSSDADAHLPDDYFLAAKHYFTHTASALVFDFHHKSDQQNPHASDTCLQATLLYERSLKYFRKGLSFAESPYAFYTLGSTLAVSIHHYVQSRGFPKRAGGEDFYLLNKLAKLGDVVFAKTICVEISARQSQRVPFGTGPAVEKILQLEKPSEDYHYYNAGIFVELRRWLQSIDTLWQALQTGAAPLEALPENIRKTVTVLGSEKFLTHARSHCKSLHAFRTQFHQWFDAFLTLKFIHHLQQNGFPPQPLHKAINQLSSQIND